MKRITLCTLIIIFAVYLVVGGVVFRQLEGGNNIVLK